MRAVTGPIPSAMTAWSVPVCAQQCRIRMQLADKSSAPQSRGDAFGAMAGSWYAPFPCEAAVCVALLGWFRHSINPPTKEQRPESHSSGNDQQPKPPTSMPRVRVNFSHANQGEGDGEHQPAGQISSKQNQ